MSARSADVSLKVPWPGVLGPALSCDLGVPSKGLPGGAGSVVVFFRSVRPIHPHSSVIPFRVTGSLWVVLALRTLVSLHEC